MIKRAIKISSISASRALAIYITWKYSKYYGILQTKDTIKAMMHKIVTIISTQLNQCLK